MTTILGLLLLFYVGYRMGKRHKTAPAYTRGRLRGFDEGARWGYQIGRDEGAQMAEEFVVRQRELARRGWQ